MACRGQRPVTSAALVSCIGRRPPCHDQHGKRSPEMHDACRSSCMMHYEMHDPETHYACSFSLRLQVNATQVSLPDNEHLHAPASWIWRRYRSRNPRAPPRQYATPCSMHRGSSMDLNFSPGCLLYEASRLIRMLGFNGQNHAWDQGRCESQCVGGVVSTT